MVGVYLRAKGVAPVEIAVLGFVGAMVSFVSRTQVALLADRTGFHRLVYRIHTIFAW